MNPKYPANLDPKLKEAYDRVMGTGAPAPKVETPAPKAADVEAHPKMVSEPIPKPASDDDKATVVHFGASTEKHKKEEKHTDTDAAKTTSVSSTTAILIGVIGVLFFLVYAFFWAQVLGFNLLPSS